MMHSILDVDLDYFNRIPDAGDQLQGLLQWADGSVTIVVNRRHLAFARWKRRWQADGLSPTHILHVDEHHDGPAAEDQHRELHVLCNPDLD